MTLPSSGEMKASAMRDEYGLTNPVKLSDFYGKPGIPASGPIKFSDFYGKSNVTINNSNSSITAYRSSGAKTNVIYYKVDGQVSANYQSGSNILAIDLFKWINVPERAGDYEISCQLISGQTPTQGVGATLNDAFGNPKWYNLGSPYSVGYNTSISNAIYTLKTTIRKVGTTTPVYEATISMEFTS